MNNNEEWAKEAVRKYTEEANKAMNALIGAECWSFIDDYLYDLCMKAWRMDENYLIEYAKITLPIKSKLPYRERFMITCKHLYPKNDVWKELI